MKLQQKFGALFAALGLTAASSVGVAAWSIAFLERELAWPLASIEEVMSGLHRAKRSVEDQAASIGFARGSGASPTASIDLFATPQALDTFRDAHAAMEREVDALGQTDSYLLRSGVSNAQNLKQRVVRLGSLADEWLDAPNQDARSSLGEELGQMHELIERLEGRILTDGRLAVGHGQRVRGIVFTLVILSALVVLLELVLAVLLIRRSIVRPVMTLQEAARRIGTGDLSVRLSPRGSDELAQLSHEINHMASMLTQLHEDRIERERLAAVGEMTRRIVHNLRKPLSGIRALAETTRQELPPDSDLGEVQDRIIRAVDRFESWLRDILRAASPLAIDPEPVDVVTWLADLMEVHTPEAEAKQVHLEVRHDAQPLHAVFDPRHLGHALSAILSNAIEFSPAGGRVLVETSTHHEHWTIRVSDEGPGIPDNLRDQIFRPYMTTRPSGTGIGLAITKRVIEQHGGTVRVLEGAQSPSHPVGAVFEMCLGLQPLASPGQRGASVGQNSGH
jgi:signal transduction histidine kinase